MPLFLVCRRQWYGTAMHDAPFYIDRTPRIGAQVIVEPGIGPDDLERLFGLLETAHMRVARVRLFEAYIKPPEGQSDWDFSLFDAAFEAAERHGVGLFATLFPDTSFEDVGGFKFADTDEHHKSVLRYVRACVAHFSRFKSLIGWVLVNEPGLGSMPETPFVRKRYGDYAAAHPVTGRTAAGYPAMDFRKERFFLEFSTDYLARLAAEVRAVDPNAHIHINPHDLFSATLMDYDFPAWRGFLDSFGGSAHASWHFGMFPRNRFCLAMAAYGSMLDSAAGELPWLMTEVQGGNTTYSGARPLCPTPGEISQWLWTIIASGGKGAIFWSFNQRSSGFEAGEWGLLSISGHSTDRLEAASAVAKTVEKHGDLLAGGEPLWSPVTVLYVRESLWVDHRLQGARTGGVRDGDQGGRAAGAPLRSALGWYAALTALGLQPRFGEIREHDFDRRSFAGETILLSHQVSLPRELVAPLRRFVERGGRLMVDGLTGYYDEDAHCTMQTGFLLADLLGGDVYDVVHVADDFPVPTDFGPVSAHLWRGEIDDGRGRAYSLRRRFGEGETIWLPSCIGLGAWVGSPESLARVGRALVTAEAEPALWFQSYHPDVVLRSLVAGDTLVTVVVNQAAEERVVPLHGSMMEKAGAAEKLFSSLDQGTAVEVEQGTGAGRRMRIGPGETLVHAWSLHETSV